MLSVRCASQAPPKMMVEGARWSELEQSSPQMQDFPLHLPNNSLGTLSSGLLMFTEQTCYKPGIVLPLGHGVVPRQTDLLFCSFYSSADRQVVSEWTVKNPC